MMVDSGASEWAATRLLYKARTAGNRHTRHWQLVARPGLTPRRATRDKAMSVGPGRRRLSRLESGASESAAAVTRLLGKARADSGDPSRTQGPSPGRFRPADPRQGPGWL